MNLTEIAQSYHSLGFNVTVITNYLTQYNYFTKEITKRPYHYFENLFKERQKIEDLLSLDLQTAIGIGTITGFQNLLVIDVDACADLSTLNTICDIISIPQDYEWIVQSGSKTGYHIYLNVPYPTEEEKIRYQLRSLEDGLACWTYAPSLRSLEFEKLEFLWKTHVVLPPSLHKSSFLYEFINCHFPKNTPLKFESFSASNLHKLIRSSVVSNCENPNSEIYISPSKHIPSNTTEGDRHNFAINSDVLCFIDIETDGLYEKLNVPRITQISWCLSHDLEGYYPLLKKQTHIINNLVFDIETVENQSSLNTSTFEIIGEDLFQVLEILKEDLDKSKIIIAYNVKFEVNVLSYYYKKYDLQFETSKWVCLMLAFSKIYPFDKYAKLSELHERLFGLSAKILHNATVDALITLRCFNMMSPFLGQLFKI